MSVQEIRAHLLDAIELLPRGPLARAAQDFDEQIARLRALAEGSTDSGLESAIAQLTHAREQCQDLLGVINHSGQEIEQYAGRI